jgi:hypothetical protein
MGLLQDIQIAATNSERSSTDLLRMAIVLASRLRHEPLAKWARSELDGYVGRSEEVPAYRRLHHAVLIGDFFGPFGSAVKNSPIPLDILPEEVRKYVREMPMVESVSSYEALGRSGKGTVHMPLPEVVSIFGALGLEYWRGHTLAEAHLRISVGTIRSVVDAVRTRLLDFALEIETVNAAAGEAPSIGPPPVDPPTVQHIFDSTIVMGGTVKQTNTKTTVTSSSNVQLAVGKNVQQRQRVTNGVAGDELAVAFSALRKSIDTEIESDDARAEAHELANELEAKAETPHGPVVRAVYEALTRISADHPGLTETVAALGVILGCAAARG